jgi:hypothetical protein
MTTDSPQGLSERMDYRGEGRDFCAKRLHSGLHLE